jgi:hypothetical protein
MRAAREQDCGDVVGFVFIATLNRHFTMSWDCPEQGDTPPGVKHNMHEITP